jgi:hypothetical protein
LHEALAEIFTTTEYALHIAIFAEAVRNLEPTGARLNSTEFNETTDLRDVRD